MIGKHEIDLPGQKPLGLWDGVEQFHLMNVAGRITGLHSSVSASFRFTRQSIHCIGQPGLRVGRFARLASKPADKQTGQNMYIAEADLRWE